MTGLNSNIDQVIEKFKAIKDNVNNIDPSEALILGVNAAKAAMQNRIFNQGQDSNNELIGKYTGKKVQSINLKRKLTQKEEKLKERLVGSQASFTPYEIKRLEAGRQVVYKDEEFTGTLRRGIIVAKASQKRVDCLVPSPRNVVIIEGQEQQTGKKIFALSEEERQILRDNTTEALKQLYVRALNS